MTRLVGLTGGIATGKSTVASVLEKLGATVVCADEVVHELQAPGSPVLAEIARAFGPEVLDERGALRREALGDLVFRDEAARRRLGEIMHPRVIAEMLRRAEEARAAGVPLVVLDIPLLLEGRRAGTGSGALIPFDAVVVVYAPEEAQVERQVARNAYSREEAERRVRAQMPIEEKRRLADHVIDNSGSPEDTERQVRGLYAELVRGGPRSGPR